MKFYTAEVLKNIPSTATIVAATKYFNSNEMIELYSNENPRNALVYIPYTYY